VLPVQVAALHVQVEGPLGPAGLDAGDAVHLRRRLQVLEARVLLIDDEVVDPQLVEHQPVVLLVLGEQVFQLRLARRLLLLDRLDEVAVGPGRPLARAVDEELVVLLDLPLQELLLVRLRHADPLEGTVGHDDRVPVA
jgi:hypothetical protein